MEHLHIGGDTRLRESVKRCVLVAFNTPDIIKYSQAMHGINSRIHVKALREQGVKIHDVYDAFMVVHPKLREFFTSVNEKSGVLMYLESAIMKNILLELHSRGINGLPLHDAVIHNRGDSELVSQIMREQYTSFTGGNEIIVKTVKR